MDDDGAELRERLVRFLAVSDPTRSPNENEARNAAVKACNLLRENQDRIAFRAAAAGGVHPLVSTFDRYGIVPMKVSAASWCKSCGDVIQAGAQAAFHPRVGATHMQCREWWATFDFSKLPPDPDEIPF